MVRLPLAIAFPWAATTPLTAVVFLGAAAASDILDGWIARRFHQETPTGAALDALMDKVFVLTVVLTLVARGSLTILEVLLLGTRDLGELTLFLRLKLQHRLASRERSANEAGKLATVFQFTAIVATLVGARHHEVWILVASACGVFAAALYWIRERRGDGVMSSR